MSTHDLIPTRDDCLPSPPHIKEASRISAEDLRPDMTNDGLNPHTCSSCQILILGEAPGKFGHEVSLSYMFSAIENGCDFFRWCVDQLDPAWGRPRDGRTWKSAVESAGQMEKAILDIAFHVKDKELEIYPSCSAPVPIGRGMGSSRPFTTLAREGDPASRVFLARPINKAVRSLRGIFNDNFVDSCHMKEDSTATKVLKFPTRLIDLGVDGDTYGPRLVVVKPGWSASYAALSYCWGGSQELCTTLATLTTRQQEISSAHLPKTLQDACFVTKQLGLRYLWIDALCIIQDSTEDMTHELAKMRDIYYGSAVTILASRASHVKQGFLHDREVDYGRTFALPYIDRDAAQPGTVIFCKQATAQIINTLEPLSTRAWALQERLLSPRTVEFGDLQTTWRWNGMIQTDGGWSHNDLKRHNLGRANEFMLDSYKAPKDRTISSTPVDDLKRTQVWSFLIQEYTSRSLTVSGDRLPAISGLAEAYEAWSHPEQPLNYLAGLWQHHFPESLLWIRRGPFISGGKYCLRDSSVAPSWSWASINRMVSTPSAPNVGCESISTTVVSATVELIDLGNRYGSVKSGQVVLRGPVFKARYNPSQDTGKLTILELGNVKFGSVTLDAREDVQSDDIDVWCIEICVQPSTGVVLRLMDERIKAAGVKNGLVLLKTEEPDTFRRIGCYYADLRYGDSSWDDYMAWFGSWESREIKLV